MALNRYWEDYYQHSDKNVMMSGGGQGLDHPTRKVLWELIPDGSTVLDVACCNALMWEQAKRDKKDIKYTGYDIMAETIERNREVYPECEFYSGDASDLDQFKDNSFDITNSRHLIDHLPHYASHFIEMYRVAKKRVIITTWRQLRTDTQEKLRYANLEEGGSWDNQYNQAIMEDFIERIIQPVHYEITNEYKDSGNSIIVVDKV